MIERVPDWHQNLGLGEHLTDQIQPSDIRVILRDIASVTYPIRPAERNDLFHVLDKKGAELHP